MIPSNLLQVFELMIDVTSSFDFGDAVILARKTFSIVTVIVTHRLKAVEAFKEALRKLVASEEEIEQELLGQIHSFKATVLQVASPHLQYHVVHDQNIQHAVTWNESDDPRDLVQIDLSLGPVGSQHGDDVVGQVANAPFVGKDVELEQVVLKYSTDIVRRQRLLVEFIIVEPDDEGQEDVRIFIIQGNDLIECFGESVVQGSFEVG